MLKKSALAYLKLRKGDILAAVVARDDPILAFLFVFLHLVSQTLEAASFSLVLAFGFHIFTCFDMVLKINKRKGIVKVPCLPSAAKQAKAAFLHGWTM